MKMDGLYPAAQVWVGSSYVQVFFIQASVRSARHLCPCWAAIGYSYGFDKLDPFNYNDNDFCSCSLVGPEAH